jgi:hypothetical protein
MEISTHAVARELSMQKKLLKTIGVGLAKKELRLIMGLAHPIVNLNVIKLQNTSHEEMKLITKYYLNSIHSILHRSYG